MSKLTWNRETKTWLFNGQPSARRKGQRGVVPVRRRAISERRLLRELKRKEFEREHQGWIAVGKTPARAAYLASLSTLPHKILVKFIKHELKRQKGKCGMFGSHRWKGGNGFCTKCGTEKRTKGMGKKITKLARYLSVKRAALSRMLNDNPDQVRKLIAERKWKEQRARMLEESNVT